MVKHGLSKFKTIAVHLVVGIVIVFLSFAGIFSQAEFALYDALFRVRGEKDPGSEVAIIAIDERSIAELGSLPWARSIHAELLERTSSAQVTAFDLLFDFPSDSTDDAAFVSAVEKSGNVVLASMFSYEQDASGNWYQQISLPYEDLCQAAVKSGFINVPVNRGNIIRSITLFDSNYYTEPYPSFSLATVLAYYNKNTLKVEENFLVSLNLDVPLDASNQALINFWGPGKTFPTYSYLDVVKGEHSPEEFSGKIVLVGVTTPVMMDYFETPFTIDNLILSGSLPSAGVEVHASAVKSLLESTFYTPVPWYANLAAYILLWILTVFLAKKLTPRVAVLSAFPVLIVTASLLYMLWMYKLWFNLFAALLIIAGGYSSVLVERYIYSESERRWVRDTFSRYLSADYVNELVRNPGKVNLGGEVKVITVLFADLRNFTAYSEKEEPEEVIKRLNQFFSAMTSIVFEYGGTLDKFNGDGFMAIFGAPVYDQKHAANGLKASLSMIQKMEELNEAWVKSGEDPLKFGLGLNSGPVIVGNIGSEERMDYTAIGRAVNLASRLEKLNKKYGTSILIGEDTISLLDQNAIPEGWCITGLGEVLSPDVGREIKVFTVKWKDTSGP